MKNRLSRWVRLALLLAIASTSVGCGLAQTIAWYTDNTGWWSTSRAETEKTYQRLGR